MNFNPNLNTLIAAVFACNGKVFLPNQDISTNGSNYVKALELSITAEQYGFVLSKDLIMALSHLPEKEINSIGQTILDSLKNSVGGHVLFEPMYPNFPQQVIEASELELFLNAVVHYMGSWIGLRILPKYEKTQRKILEKIPTPKVVDICSATDLANYMKNMVTANVSYSVAQCYSLNAIAPIFDEFTDIKFLTILNNCDIPNKENLAFWANYIVKNTDNTTFNQVMLDKFSTVTDVLRFVAAYSEGDKSLAATFKVAKLSRPMRKLILNLTEKVCNKQSDKDQLGENFLKYRSEWVRVAFACHSGEYSRQYPETTQFLSKLRNNEKIRTFNGELETAYANGDVDSLVTLLSIRPGVFARNLTRLLAQEKPEFEKFVSKKKQAALALALYNKKTQAKKTIFGEKLSAMNIQTKKFEEPADATCKVEFTGFTEQDHARFVQSFGEVADKISTPVLLQVHNHFKNMEAKMKAGGRAIMPKGGVSKMFYQSGSIGTYDLALCKQIETIAEQALINRFAKLPALGYTYIDPELKSQNIPFAMRSASKALKTVARGSTFPVEDKSNVRLFLWWKEAKYDRCDIDLSASMYDENFKNVGHCGYWHLRDEDGAFTHSGDIVSAPNGACEFIDIRRNLIPKNAAYIVMTLSSFSGQKYCDLPECFAGWMERDDDMQAGEVFDARTVNNKVDLSSNTTNIMPIVYDVKNNRMIWIDTAYSNGAIASNAHQNSDAISMILKSFVEGFKPNLHDLFEMHAKARGTIIDNPENADNIFSIHNGVTPYDFDVITSEFMADA